jgi:predicted SprT family Zn-dependent metalloprotease
MELKQAEKLARELIEKHNPKCKFKFDNAKRRFGCCKRNKFSGELTISLSKDLTLMNDEEKVKDTILHELAHSLVDWGHGHDWVWRSKALEIGCNGERCYDSNVVNKPKGKYVYVCPNCKKEYDCFRKRKRASACAECCNKYNNGRYTDKFKLELKEVNK